MSSQGPTSWSQACLLQVSINGISSTLVRDGFGAKLGSGAKCKMASHFLRTENILSGTKFCFIQTGLAKPLGELL